VKNAMQLKAVVKKIAKNKHISAQLVLQNYMLERFLERISRSSYRDYFVIKGGFLIASIVGLDTRATMDMDATIKNYPVNEETIRKMIRDIAAVPVDDGITFKLKRVTEIRESDEYTGYRAALSANYEKMAVPLKLDITTGDKITPREIEYQYPLMLEDRKISVLAYNLATILAEKLETVIVRGDQNTRPRDYYDIYILIKLHKKQIDLADLKTALDATAWKRGSSAIIEQYREIIEVVRNSDEMNRRWENYQREFEYAQGINFSKTCDTVVNLMQSLYAIQRR
jgi:predicted nucleotidyltransferase component of viral defense system